MNIGIFRIVIAQRKKFKQNDIYNYVAYGKILNRLLWNFQRSFLEISEKCRVYRLNHNRTFIKCYIQSAIGYIIIIWTNSQNDV